MCSSFRRCSALAGREFARVTGCVFGFAFMRGILIGEFNNGCCDDGQALQDAEKYVSKTLVAQSRLEAASRLSTVAGS